MVPAELYGGLFRKAVPIMAAKQEEEWVKPDFATLGFVRVEIAGGTGLNEAGFFERTIKLSLAGKSSVEGRRVVATLRYPVPTEGPHRKRHFVTTESFQVMYIVDGDERWLRNGRTPILEADLKAKGDFAHFRT